MIVFGIDGGSPAKSSPTATVTVVVDRNLNAPEFSSPTSNLALPENTPLNAPLFQFTASDKDKAVNFNFIYDVMLFKTAPYFG